MALEDFATIMSHMYLVSLTECIVDPDIGVELLSANTGFVSDLT